VIKNEKELKKFYYLSFLGLIPAFGIIIGLYLLIYTGIKFRKWKLAFVIVINIGLGILVMKVDEYYLKRELKYGKNANNGFKYIAQAYLDDLKNQIEKYKDYVGEYPDSLLQVKKLFPDIVIEDPLLGENDMGTHKKYFYYVRKADTFALFSSGIDRIPNTKDDLYPRMVLK
jgi:hypothetical protein